MTHLSGPPQNINLIWEVCESLGTDKLTTFVGYHWGTGVLRVNLTTVKGGVISNHLLACTGLKCKPWQSVGWNTAIFWWYFYTFFENVLLTIGLYRASQNTLDDILFIHALQNANDAGIYFVEDWIYISISQKSLK